MWNDRSQTATDFADSLYTTSSNQLLIRAAGGIGVGTNSPTADIHVSGNSDATHPHLYLQETGAGDFARLRMQNSDSAAGYWDIAAGGTNTGRLNFFTRDHNVVTFWPHGIDFGGGNLITTSVGAELTQGGVWQNNSARASKTDFEPLDVRHVLETMVTVLCRLSLPIGCDRTKGHRYEKAV